MAKKTADFKIPETPERKKETVIVSVPRLYVRKKPCILAEADRIVYEGDKLEALDVVTGLGPEDKIVEWVKTRGGFVMKSFVTETVD